MPRFDPPMHMQNYVPSAFGTVENHRHYLGDLGAAASAASLTIAQRKEIFKRNRQLVRDQLRRKNLLDKIDVNADGSLLLKSPALAIDRAVARTLRTDLLAKVTLLSEADKRRLAERPFSFAMSIFDPAIDFFGDVCNEIMHQTSQKIYDLSDIPGVGAAGKRVDLTLVQPDDAMFDATSRRQLKSIRTLLATCVLFFKQWPAWTACLLAHGFESVGKLIFGEEEQVVLVSIDKGSDGSSAQDPRLCTRLPNIPDLAGPYRQGDQSYQPSTSDFNRNRVMWIIPPDGEKKRGKSFIKLTWTALYDYRFAAGVRAFTAAFPYMTRAQIEATVRRSLGDRASAVAADRLENKPAGEPPVGGLSGLSGLGALGVVPAAAAAPAAPIAQLLTAEVLTLLNGLPLIVQIIITVGAVLISLGALVVLPIITLCFEHEEAMRKTPAPATKTPPAPQAQPPPALVPSPPPIKTQTETGGGGGGVSPLLLAGALGLAVLVLNKR